MSKKNDNLAFVDFFTILAKKISWIMGTPWAFIIAALVIVFWAILGPFFEFSNTWQLFVNSFTTIITFLMVFLIQNTQNRDAKSIELKLDELLNHLRDDESKEYIKVEDLTEEEIDLLSKRFEHLKPKKKK